MNSLDKIRRLLPAIFVLAVYGANAHAYLDNPGTCTLDSVTITHMETSPLDGNGVIFTAPPSVNATSCFGIAAGNDFVDPSPNIGELEDGMLNGENNVISPLQFISSSQLLDLDGDGNFTDPGWIYLGKVETADGQTSYTMDGYNKPLNIDDILTLTLKCTDNSGDACRSGTWELVTELDIVEVVRAQLGRSSFDHLAFVLKGGNGFGIYDFDFNKLLDQLLAAGAPTFDFDTPYSFTGDWNMDDFVFPNANGRGGLDPRALSHVSVWVRDPLDELTVPEPGTLVLIALGLLFVTVTVRNRGVSLKAS